MDNVEVEVNGTGLDVVITGFTVVDGKEDEEDEEDGRDVDVESEEDSEADVGYCDALIGWIC